jgi:hypothetical protein
MRSGVADRSVLDQQAAPLVATRGWIDQAAIDEEQRR